MLPHSQPLHLLSDQPPLNTILVNNMGYEVLIYNTNWLCTLRFKAKANDEEYSYFHPGTEYMTH